MKIISSIFLVCSLFLSCNSPAQKSTGETSKGLKVVKIDAEWRSQLSPEAYNVLRKERTERAFSSELNNNTQEGTYVCAGCGSPVFKSEHKFDSGTGWHSFDREIEGNVAFKTENKLGFTRIDEHSNQENGHPGRRCSRKPQNK